VYQIVHWPGHPLHTPIARVAALDTWVGYHPQLEGEILPQTDDLVREAERLLGY
jgi:2-oxoisovalerate dehydrogenase E1 component